MIQKTRKILWLIGVIITLLGTLLPNVTSFAQDEEADWSYKIYDQGVRTLMNALHEEWRTSDGAKTIDIGDQLFWSLLLDPNEF